jgi:hypothetical protein
MTSDLFALFIYFLVGLGFELRALHLPAVHFALVILEMESCAVFAQSDLES